ncbi:MAG: 50S ribosomal protein L32 [Caldanaerobacter subterraneus]|jgi:large subunit ribosomal protein L32|uniref:Large ribosomal subunit protein bL32 n=3 Tax=Caldanaerobacter subterraneus TaxID=911092 RepID=A0A101E7L8_9THEO|nr:MULTISPECIES: 50S ribosomal protein L32 [Caldanaerobacter]ERM92436.1 50S ribosomal protein L32 [Caldanaerobacter subterraneus subsp. yonseiensis KB-1]KKC29544.1 hypothetical protein CDSM653_01394 [Caldanaerobacter subterraneus subsp. pacificus DSM 12653]KUK09917.1 MAG: 50S ribosomal protein L32 [Caldanaerobacter subterraneus]MCS3915738.1 large subunit ribosomal protein L32 [Caldanaerobacter subterraneus subsp. tengcongensis MB4]MDI3518352.1 large subunit ribosomal protein [Caldanaerobacter 
MGGVPKRRTSKARRDTRRNNSFKIAPPAYVLCPRCHQPKLPHRVCPNCGYYKDKEVIKVEE